MTEGFGAFRDAISNLETAAGGGSLDDGFYINSLQNPPGPGYVQAEDGSWVPPGYWDDPPVRQLGPGDPGYLDDGFEANALQHPYQPGYVQFEDGSWGNPYPDAMYDE